MKNKLTAEEQEFFIEKHLPYRLGLLKAFEDFNKEFPNKHGYLKNSCAEASRIASRMFIEFLGIKSNKNLQLDKHENYREDDVNVEDLGGKFVEINDLTDSEKKLLAEVYLTGNKSTAHFTYGGEFVPKHEIIFDGIKLIWILLKEHLRCC